jgi:hypothetical protein
MKRRLTPFLIGITVILIGSLAYAADRKKQTKRVDLPGDRIHEEEALRAELLDAVEGHDKKSHDVGTPGKVAGNNPGGKTDQLKSNK